MHNNGNCATNGDENLSTTPFATTVKRLISKTGLFMASVALAITVFATGTAMSTPTSAGALELYYGMGGNTPFAYRWEEAFHYLRGSWAYVESQWGWGAAHDNGNSYEKGKRSFAHIYGPIIGWDGYRAYGYY